jgi:hypothetical protein
MASHPPQGPPPMYQNGSPPQQGGYPPQQGGYPPQQGGYPPMKAQEAGFAPVYQANPYPGQQQQVVVVHQQRSSLEQYKLMIPIMPLPVAIILAILNLFPGLGTFISGWTTLCCVNEGAKDSEKAGSIAANMLVGILQFALAFLFIGFFWSLFWGFLFIVQSVEGNRAPVTAITTTSTTQGIPPAYSPA